jgi:amino acid transporter
MVNFWVSKTGSQAIISTVFAKYLMWIMGQADSLDSTRGEWLTKMVAVVLCIALCVTNSIGVRESATLQNVLTVSKVLMVGFVCVAAIAFVAQNDSYASNNFGHGNMFGGETSFFGFFTGMVAALWAYDGWADLNFLAEELIDPTRNIPRVTACGLAIVTVAYVCANVAYLCVLKQDDIEDSHAIGIDFGEVLGGSQHGAGLATFIALGVVLSTAGSANGSIMTGGRAFYAVARDKKAPAFFAQVNKAGSPWAALTAQCAWTCVLVLLPGSSFAALLDYFGPVSWSFYAFTSSCVVRLRMIEPDTYRPFKVPFYPLTPIFTAVVAVCILVSSLASAPLFTSLALVFCTLALPARWAALKYYPSAADPHMWLPSHDHDHDLGHGQDADDDQAQGQGQAQGYAPPSGLMRKD